MALQPGDRLGPYEVRTLLGAGGMGEVYRGRDTRLGRDVALKVISPKLVDNDTSRHRFEREARAASALNHPAIVTVYDVGETNGVSWIAMEWVDGRTVRELLAGGPLPIQDVLSIARQVAEGLAAAHNKGVIHRDLKPENVIIASDGRVRILDFGLARQTMTEGFHSSLAAAETMLSAGATVEGVILGTVGYMSPEQAAGSSVDFRSDQFAFGLLLYEMLAGARAFPHTSAVEALWATIREDPAPLASLRAGVPEALERVVARCLSKKPHDRFASTADLAAALQVSASATRETAAPTIVLPDSATAPAAHPAPWRRSAALVGGILVVIAMAVFAWKALTTSRAIDSLAVLPFDNRSTDPESSYLGDQLTESLIDQISRVSSLRVTARATAFREKGADPREAGRKLGVGAVLTGTVARQGADLTVSAELVEAGTGTRLWGNTYTRPSAELMQVQDLIVSEVAEKLKPTLSREEKRTLGTQGTDNPEAYERFLKARHLLLSGSEGDDLEARRLYQEAVEKDPKFVDAYLGLASTYVRSGSEGFELPKNAWAQADEQLKKVRTLDPDNFALRVALAARRFLYEWDWTGAEREFRELSKDPRVFLNNKYHPTAMFFWARGWTDEAVGLVEKALKVDPGNLESRIMLGDLYAHAGRLDDAIAYYRTIADIAPSDPRALFGLAEMLKRKADTKGAIETLRKAYELTGESEGAAALAGALSDKDYDNAQATVVRERLRGLEELARDRYISPLDFARLHALLGERDKALQRLDMAISERSPMVVLLKVDPAWDRVRDDPRFAAVVRRVGIP